MNIRGFIALMAIIKLFSSCTPSAQDDGLGHHHHAHNQGEDHNADEIVLSTKQATQFGVYSQMVKPIDFNEVIQVSGQIVSSPGDKTMIVANSSGILHYNKNIVEGKRVNNGSVIASVSAKNIAGGDVNEAQRVELEVAERELERIKPLYEEGIVSEKDYNAAKLRYENAKLSYTGNNSGSKVVANSSGSIIQLLVNDGEFVNAGQAVAVISSNIKMTLRADVPEKYYKFIQTIKTANFKPVYSDSIIALSKLNGEIVSKTANSSVEHPGYIPVYFTFDNNGSVVPGSYTDVYLISHTKRNSIALPIDAVIEQQGNYFVYVKLDDECYEKRLVKIGNTDGNKIEILSGLSRKDEVVTHGAIIIKLAESSGSVPEGHSHSH